MKLVHALVASAAFALLAAPTSAQFGDTWVQFVKDTSMISAGSPISNADNETDLAWGDLDKDGWIDVVVVRSVPFINVGKRTNVLLMNENGVLTDRTSTYAATSDVDSGFLTPTQDRDVVIADVNGDTWLDVITATDQPAGGDSKAIAHPRVYINLKDDLGGNWLGLSHEDARIPQLLTIPGGTPVNPRFLSVSAGDVDDDGDTDLYFGDMDFVGIFVPEPAAEDTDDRLLINDGTGFFSDGTLAALTETMRSSAFCNNTVLADFNLDGELDIMKQNGHFDPTDVIYNDPLDPGDFLGQDENVYTGNPYFANAGDLNGDGRPDLVISDNSTDKWLINTATVGGEVVWSAPGTYEFLAGADDGFGANSLVADLDQDGWGDVLIADVDPEIPGYTRRMHIYHNRGGTVGGTDIVLREERESASDTDWVGVVGMNASDLGGTHDVAVFDVDNDTLPDMVVSRLEGTVVWRQFEPWEDLRSGLAGTTGVPTLTGSGSLLAGDPVTLTLSGALGGASTTLVIGFSNLSAPFKGGTLVPNPDLIIFGFTTSGAGGLVIPGLWPPGLPSGVSIYFQEWIADGAAPAGFAASNGLSGTTP